MTVVLDAVSQGYGMSTVIDSLSVALRPGITALLGPNGAGKTTLLRTLATVLPPRNGRIRIDDVEVSGERSARQVRDRDRLSATRLRLRPEDDGHRLRVLRGNPVAPPTLGSPATKARLVSVIKRFASSQRSTLTLSS
ncbi:ATP-binding cassette domain-containing protein [Micromonospora haikouensis]|uniref:ATP-binding cassette domain-containing protein n=1 Tax=Micromonospora haikouensis TaxID=686309 RepID=UPI003795CEB3